ncbi:MAG: hypothetical protein D6756_12675 [Cyanobacteria bacterium J083]|nr:MAG: hypothetical protein D6756_12675 [Cyanobacteria bacterium J083]
MVRRRSLPWIYRWSRPLIGAIAIAGAVLTAYLTVTKLTGGEVACSIEAIGKTAGCSNVLDSEYAVVFGLPLSLFGSLAYLGMAAFALSPLAIGESNKSFKNQLEDITWLFLFMGSLAMTIFSGYLMYVLAFKIQAVCYYCIGSALFSLSMLVLTLVGRQWHDIGQLFFIGIIVALVTIVATLGIYKNIENKSNDNIAIQELVDPKDGLIRIPRATTEPTPPNGWEITTTSGEAEIALAKYLSSQGVKKYGAFWCPHCYEQKQLFGKEAFKIINYIECDPRGKNPQRELCVAAGIKSFPTWEIKGKLYPGTKSLQELAKLSGYQGPSNFKYKL